MRDEGVQLHENGDYWRAIWYDSNGKRRFKSLGAMRRVTKTAAIAKCRDIERAHLITPTARDMGKAPTLAAWSTAYMAGRNDLAEGTRALHGKTLAYLAQHFGEERRLDRIDRNAAAEFRAYLGALDDDDGDPIMTETTVCAHIRNCKVIFGRAAKRDLIPYNPFDREIGTPPEVDHDWADIDDQAMDKLLEACPHVGWRCLFALCRWAGLRRGEALRLSWTDLDWQERTASILPALNGKGKRQQNTKQKRREVPLSPRLYKLLRETYDDAAEGSSGPCDGVGSPRYNMHRDSLVIIRHAGLPEYSKPFHTLRKCCETEWMDQHPAMTVAKWMGHSPTVAAKHYHRPTKEAIAKVTGTADDPEKLKAQIEALQAKLAQIH